tara:strand:+ start:372 stop:575 length:204 start_codon:yes stop_codon:yes gene_type:complete
MKNLVEKIKYTLLRIGYSKEEISFIFKFGDVRDLVYECIEGNCNNVELLDLCIENLDDVRSNIEEQQ